MESLNTMGILLEQLNATEILFITLGLISLGSGLVLALGAPMGRMNDEDERGRGL